MNTQLRQRERADVDAVGYEVVLGCWSWGVDLGYVCVSLCEVHVFAVGISRKLIVIFEHRDEGNISQLNCTFKLLQQ